MTHCTISLKEHLLQGSSHCSVPDRSERGGVNPSLFVDVFIADDLVGNPVEDVEDEESQRESSPGDGVYPLGSVHKLFPHGVNVLGGRRLRVWSGSRVLNCRAVLSGQTLTDVVARVIKAAFTHVLLLRNTEKCF